MNKLKKVKKNKQIQFYNKIAFNPSYLKKRKVIKPLLESGITYKEKSTLNKILKEINEEGVSKSEDSFEEMCMLTARNRWRKKKPEVKLLDLWKNAKSDNLTKQPNVFSKISQNILESLQNKEKKQIQIYDILEIRDNLRIYKYSNIERENPHNLIYEYKYDKFNKKDYDSAHVILFIGKTGDGKSTCINAFFNIIKGIKLEDNHRFILIKEQEKLKGQAESQTDGLHFYYVKDINKKPIIIIDSQGFGDTRGKEYDELIMKAFEYTFSSMINHINTICFVGKSNNSRLDIQTKYIFSCMTSLFSEDVNEKIIILNTHADKSTMYEGPLFLGCISADENFKNIIKKMDKKWWYAVESVNILDNYIDRLTIYSFEQMNSFYEEKIKKSKPKNISKTLEITKNRNKIKYLAQTIINYYHNIINEKNKISEIEDKIKEYDSKINDIGYEINSKQLEIDNIYIPNKDYELSNLRSDRDNRIYQLENEYDEKYVRELEYDGGNHTYCTNCKKNCHEYCDCFGQIFGSCTVFPFFGSYCEKCDHHKSNHCLHSGSKYIDKYERTKRDNYWKIRKEEDYYYNKEREIESEYNEKIKLRDSKKDELNKLNNTKNELNNDKNNYINKITTLKNTISQISKDIKVIILDLLKISRNFDYYALNKFHYDIENKYIENMIEDIKEIGDYKKEQIKKLIDFKKYNDIFLEIGKTPEKEIITMNVDTLLIKLKKLI